MIGGLPDYKGPLNARTTGRVTNDFYTMEKVIFESLPGYLVTADLYLPLQPGRHPGVLMSAGHTTLGKTENHRIAANLAAKGFVALAYDPVGLGERVQAYDARVGGHLGGCCTNEHLHAGAQSLLIDESVARFFIWDAMRALDYMVSRPEVDADRLGAAGCSGGGCLTTYITALDPRVKTGAPACFINSFRLLYAGPDPDSEMALPEFLSSGLDHADFLEMVAPKPWLILATEGDFFTPPAARMVYDEARRWYRMYDAEDRVHFFVGPGPHGTPLETREQIYGWMIRWLKDGKGDPREQKVTLYSDHELQVTQSGQVENEPNSRKLFEVIRDEYRAKRQPLGVPELLAELRRLQIPSGGQAPAVKELEVKAFPTFRRQHIQLEAEPGVDVDAWLYVPQSPARKKGVLVVKERYSEGKAEGMAAAGHVVLELEPRDSPAGNDHRPYLGNWQTNARVDAIGGSLPAMRAHDLLRGVDYLLTRKEVAPGSVIASGRDVRGIWLLLAAAVDPRIESVWVDRTPQSLASALDGPLAASIFEATIRGFLLHWDLQDLVKAMGPRKVLWTDPTNWMSQVQTLGPPFRYRISGQTDVELFEELLR